MIGDSAVRPWGSWQVLDEGDGFKVKRIVVEPGCRLSYQTHEHRAEHWTVVAGVATCVIDDEEKVLQIADSVNVAVGQAHRITNMHDEPLIIIEVQHGSYTGEDDIVRLSDDYGRCETEIH
ncbi:phosphomannose isomerase type II C-terminal cupin domain [Nocardioides panacisoli]|uniref:phosphomannose isomerase type II C-terminal cupin domain n=1 Tax=Nocardioides panacisoli TaxID=627624 RepID=UPI001C637824|nr:phosphomannose isomerase type II C-terminal cupin domain [Nocardioides panacisoli]QYJ03972.1 phosphomannose isomerase type II C-terminal cupin domain [Nocardioides panacisoli]